MGQHVVAIWMSAHLHYLLITVKVIAFEEFSFSDTQNPKSVCYHIDSQWEVLPAYQRQFNANNSDAIIWKTKNFLWIFFAFLKSILNFKHLAKNDDPQSWCISGKTGSEKHD